MFTKIARLVKRRSTRIEVESTTPDIGRVQVVIVDEPHPQPQSEPHPPPPPPREVVDTAPDLLRWSTNLETPFPSVAFGGYIKYYKAHADPNIVHPLFNLPVVAPPPLSSHPILASPRKSPESPTETVREALPPPPVKNPRSKARRYTLSSSSTPFSLISEKNLPQQLFRRQWKRASCIISSSIAEHDLSPLFNNSSAQGRPSFDMAGSLSSKTSSESSSESSSSSSSSSSSPPDSIAFEFRQNTTTSPDSTISTLPPNSPTSIYSTQDDDGDVGMIIMVESPKSLPCSSDLLSDTPCRRPISSSSYGTAQTAFSQGS